MLRREDCHQAARLYHLLKAGNIKGAKHVATHVLSASYRAQSMAGAAQVLYVLGAGRGPARPRTAIPTQYAAAGKL